MLQEDVVEICMWTLERFSGIYEVHQGPIGPRSFVNAMTFQIVFNQGISLEAALHIAFLGVPLQVEMAEPMVTPCGQCL